MIASCTDLLRNLTQDALQAFAQAVLEPDGCY